MDNDIFFALFNAVLATIVLALFYPVFKAKTLTDLDEALETRPFLARALQRQAARSYFYPFLYYGLPFVAYYWLTDGDKGSTNMQLAALSVVLLFAVSIARVWKFRRLLADEQNLRTTPGHVPDFPAFEAEMADPEVAGSRVEETSPHSFMSAAPESRPDAVQCPACGSMNINSKNYARRTGGAIGTMAGAAAGLASVAGGAEIGATVGVIGGPVGVALGGLAGAMIGALVGGATGCAAGKALGGVVDDTLLENYTCRECGCTFNGQNH